MVTLHPEEALERVLAGSGVVYLVGGLDTGKTTFALDVARRAAAAGTRVGLVDADIVQSTVGPPTTIGLKMWEPGQEVSKEGIGPADGLAFVGSLVPKGHLLPIVTGTTKLVARARREGCGLVVVDTTSLVSGIYGQVLKFHKMDMLQPAFVVAFARGGELEPVVGIAQRFTSAEVLEVSVVPEVEARSVEERAVVRERQFAAYFSPGVSRWRVKPTVFIPRLPPDFDLAQLDGLVVGMEDGTGNCVGIGVLEHDPDEDVLRMASPVTEGVRGLRLGSTRMDLSGRSRGPVALRHLLGSE